MSDIINLAQYAIDKAPEAEILAAGTEAELRIISMKKDEDKNGDEYILPVFDVPDEPNVLEFSDFMGLPSMAMKANDEKKYLKCLRKLQAFGLAFDIDWSEEFAIEELVGKRGYAILGIRKSDEYGNQNSIRKYVAGY